MLEDAIESLKTTLEKSKEKEPKKKGGSCGGASNGGQSSEDTAEYPSGGNPETQLGDVGMDDIDDSVNTMCKKVFTVHRAIPRQFSCPQARRDNVADQFTPLDDLVTMEKTCRDFLNLEGKIYDAESTNPRFFASEDWVLHYEKDKNVVLAALDQYKANIIRMQHLYTVVDDNSYNKLASIPSQDSKEAFQTNVLWTSRALQDWVDGWFIQRNAGACTKLWSSDYWLPGLIGEMVNWMKLGSYNEFDMNNISNETMARKVDRLEAVIDRLMNSSAVQQTISKYVNLKEQIESTADQKKEKIFTSQIIDSQMGKKLGVTDTGVENQKPEGTTYVQPEPDDVENVNLVCKLSCVKKLFKQMREKSLDTMKTCRCVSSSGPGPYPQIWTQIDSLASKVYGDLAQLNKLVLDMLGDNENPEWHCGITHSKLCPTKLSQKIAAFKCVIQQGVVDVMTHQAMLPKKGLNILDSMFNQLWEYGEKGPTLEMPSWCQEAIASIDKFEKGMEDAWSEVFDCWEREFLTRLWRIMHEHHTTNWKLRIDTGTVTGIPNGLLTGSGDVSEYLVEGTLLTLDQVQGWLQGVLICPTHLSLLEKPIPIAYRVGPIAYLCKNYRPDVKALCRWMTSAIQAIGIKQAAISAVMSDPSLNGECNNNTYLAMINDLRTKNHELLAKVEHAYGIYSDVENMKNKKEYDEEIALHELQPNKYSNEDQMNMTSSVQSETNESGLDSELCQGGIDITELKPWNHLSPSENHIEPEPLPVKCICNKFDKVVKTISGFETFFNK